MAGNARGSVLQLRNEGGHHTLMGLGLKCTLKVRGELRDTLNCSESGQWYDSGHGGASIAATALTPSIQEEEVGTS